MAIPVVVGRPGGAGLRLCGVMPLCAGFLGGSPLSRPTVLAAILGGPKVVLARLVDPKD